MRKKSLLPDDLNPQGFLKEVDEALHEENMRSLWRTWRWFILMAVALLLVGTAAGEAWKAWQRHQAQAVAEQWYVVAKMKPEEPGYADKLKALEAASPAGYRALALFGEAAQAEGLTPPDQTTAAAKYALVASDSGMPGWLRDLATLNEALALMGSNDANAKALLDGLVAKPEGPAYAAALELSAVMAMKKGDTVAARDLTAKLLDLRNIPPDLRQRALRRMGDLSTLAR